MSEIFHDILGTASGLVNRVGQNTRSTLDPNDWLATLGIGGDLEMVNNVRYAQDSARRHGIDEGILIRLLSAENGLKNSGGNGGGPGQMLETTAKGEYGVSQAYLRSHPKEAIELTADYLKKQIDYFDGDVSKGIAAYTAGAGNVEDAIKISSKTSSTWQEALQAIYKKEKYHGDPLAYLNKVQGESSTDPRLSNDAERRKRLKLEDKTTTPGTVSGGYRDVEKAPSPKDFYIDVDGDGTLEFDSDSFYKAMQAHRMWQESRKAERDFNQSNVAEYIDDVIEQVGKEIAVGNLKLSQANSLVQSRINSYKTALDAFEGDAFKYGVPAGAEYVPGREPGGYFDKVVGLKPLRPTGASIDPLQESLSQWEMAQGLYSGINTPSVPDFAKLRREGYAAANPQVPNLAPNPPGADIGRTGFGNLRAGLNSVLGASSSAQNDVGGGFFAEALKRIRGTG